MQLDPDVADAMEVKTALVGLQLPAFGVLPLERVEPCACLEPREPRCLAALAALKEPLEGLVEAPERAPAHRHAECQDLGSDLAKLGQRPALLDVADRSALPLPGTAALLEGRIVKFALEPQRAIECVRLLDRRIGPELVGPTLAHPSSVEIGCDIPPRK